MSKNILAHKYDILSPKKGKILYNKFFIMKGCIFQNHIGKGIAANPNIRHDKFGDPNPFDLFKL